MRVKILTHVSKAKVFSYIPARMNVPSESMLTETEYTILLFPTDFQKTVVRSGELERILSKIDRKEPLVIIAGQLTLDAQEMVRTLNAIIIVKRDVHSWTDESYNSTKVDLGRKTK